MGFDAIDINLDDCPNWLRPISPFWLGGVVEFWLNLGPFLKLTKIKNYVKRFLICFVLDDM